MFNKNQIGRPSVAFNRFEAPRSIQRPYEKFCSHRYGWSIKDECKYLDDAVKNHGKAIYANQAPVDGIRILENWLNTFRNRRWDFNGAESLKSHAILNLAEIRNSVEQAA